MTRAEFQELLAFALLLLEQVACEAAFGHAAGNAVACVIAVWLITRWKGPPEGPT